MSPNLLVELISLLKLTLIQFKFKKMFREAFRVILNRHILDHYRNPYPNIVLFTAVGGIIGANSDREIINGTLGACIGATVAVPFGPFMIIGAFSGITTLVFHSSIRFLENIIVVSS